MSSTGIVQRALKLGQTTIIKPLHIVAPWRCVFTCTGREYWFRERVGVHTYEFGLNFPRGSREGEEDLNLRRKWGSIIPTCNTIFKLMVYKQNAGTHYDLSISKMY